MLYIIFIRNEKKEETGNNIESAPKQFIKPRKLIMITYIDKPAHEIMAHIPLSGNWPCRISRSSASKSR
jgi:hypothetical protein